MKVKMQNLSVVLALLALSTLNAQLSTAHAQGTTAFTYQGQLRDNGTNANGAYTMIFKLYDSLSGGYQIGAAITNSPTLFNGLFTVNLDFGAGAFNGSARWLDITISNGVVQTLSPRVQVLPSPYAQFAAVAGGVTNETAIMTANAGTNLTIIRGIVSDTGAPYSGTPGFTVSHTSAGHYHVTFTKPFSAPPAITLAAGESWGYTVNLDNGLNNQTASDFYIVTETGTSGSTTPTDAAFQFIAVGSK
jgi:hypothetical protein